MKKLGLDIGTKTIGVAMSDAMNMIAHVKQTLIRKNAKDDVRQVVDIILDNDIDTVVIGLPKNMNNTLGDMAQKVITFHNALEKKIKYSDKLQEKNVKIVLWDERLTTSFAENVLIEAGIRRENRKKYIDSIAAQRILQSYMDSLSRETD